MKLRQLEIENFGLFSGQLFEFDHSGFQLVIGPNEAGKSTLLQLVRELLFGFQVQNAYAFADHPTTGRLGGMRCVVFPRRGTLLRIMTG